MGAQSSFFGRIIFTKMLSRCPDCGESVSSEAAACPKCGRPLRSLFDPRIWIGWTLAHASVTISVLLIFSAWASSEDSAQRSLDYGLWFLWKLSPIIFFPILPILNALNLSLRDGLTYPLIFINSASTVLLLIGLHAAMQTSRRRR